MNNVSSYSSKHIYVYYNVMYWLSLFIVVFTRTTMFKHSICNSKSPGESDLLEIPYALGSMNNV